jgi:uncharacterized membrane protein YcaP (DUF421 family)
MEDWIGSANETLSAGQTILRAVIIFITALVCIRISGMRSFGKSSALDVVVSIIVGSVLARAIGGHVPFFASIAATLVLSVIHRALAFFSVRSDRLSNLLKGKEYLLVKNGEMQRDNMKYCSITEGDLMEGIRMTANVNDLQEIKEAYFERSGQISAIPREKK